MIRGAGTPQTGEKKGDEWKYISMEHMVNFWNLLPQEGMKTNSAKKFKMGLDIFMGNRFVLKNSGPDIHLTCIMQQLWQI